MAYEFHYTPTGTGVISGKEVLEQTEDAINDLGDQISGDVQTAIDTANNALNTANTASVDAQNAVNTASTAYTAATNAQNTANAAQNTASNALTAAQNAQNDVNALGNRVTTAEGNITQNTNAITGLTTRMGTAEGNITNLQTAVSTAQATANSAQQTATTARQQSYVFRYSGTAITDNSTIAYSTIDNTDNIKSGDKILDVDGKLFEITAVDTTNQTVTVGTALIDLALDANVVHLSGNETVSGTKDFSGILRVYNSNSSLNTAEIWLKNSKVNRGQAVYGDQGLWFRDATDKRVTAIISRITSNGASALLLYAFNENQDNQQVSNYLSFIKYLDGTCYLLPDQNDAIVLGSSSAKFKSINTNLINGLTPSSLSFPSNTGYVDISGYFTNTGDGQTNSYTASVNGWIYLNVVATSLIMQIRDSNDNVVYADMCNRSSDGTIYMTILIGSGNKLLTQWFTSSSVTITTARFIPCQGNI